MEVLYPRCCGLDIHKRMVMACLVTPGQDGPPVKTIRTFGTMTEDLLGFRWVDVGQPDKDVRRLARRECAAAAAGARWLARVATKRR
jgi:hypothetical protein